MASTRQVAGQLSRLINEASDLVESKALSEDLEQLLRDSSSRVAIAEVICADLLNDTLATHWVPLLGFNRTASEIMTSLASQEDLCARIETSDTTIRLRFHNWTKPAPRSLSMLPASVIICDLSRLGNPEIGMLAELELFVADRLWLFFSDSQSSNGFSYDRIARAALLSRAIQGAEMTIERQLASLDKDSLFETLAALSLARAVEGVLTVWAQALDEEVSRTQTLIKSRTKLLQPSSASVAPDGTTVVRASVQQCFTQFERDSEERLQDFIAPTVGLFWAEITEWISSIDDLEEERRGRSTLFRLSGAATRQLVDKIRTSLSNHVSSDLSDLKLIGSRISRAIESRSTLTTSEHVSFSVNPLPPMKLSRLLNTAIVFQRGHEAEVRRSGTMEVISGIRKPLMILMMLLTPFGAVPILRKYPEIYIPVTVFLLGVGLFSAIVFSKRDHAHEQERERSKAQETVRSEVRRMLAEFQTKWMAAVKTHLADEVQRISSEFESQARDRALLISQQATERKQQLQIELQRAQAADKNLSSVLRSRDTLVATLQQTLKDLRSAIPRGSEDGAR